jgi:hypothetical protein
MGLRIFELCRLCFIYSSYVRNGERCDIVYVLFSTYIISYANEKTNKRDL